MTEPLEVNVRGVAFGPQPKWYVRPPSPLAMVAWFAILVAFAAGMGHIDAMIDDVVEVNAFAHADLIAGMPVALESVRISFGNVLQGSVMVAGVADVNRMNVFVVYTMDDWDTMNERTATLDPSPQSGGRRRFVFEFDLTREMKAMKVMAHELSLEIDYDVQGWRSFTDNNLSLMYTVPIMCNYDSLHVPSTKATAGSADVGYYDTPTRSRAFNHETCEFHASFSGSHETSRPESGNAGTNYFSTVPRWCDSEMGPPPCTSYFDDANPDDIMDDDRSNTDSYASGNQRAIFLARGRENIDSSFLSLLSCESISWTNHDSNAVDAPSTGNPLRLTMSNSERRQHSEVDDKDMAPMTLVSNPSQTVDDIESSPHLALSSLAAFDDTYRPISPFSEFSMTASYHSDDTPVGNFLKRPIADIAVEWCCFPCLWWLRRRLE